jgi:D-glycerate 3-kinase
VAATIVARAVLARRRETAGALVVGLCGAQGSGKSTVAEAVEATLAGVGVAAATLSLDDLYLTRAARQALAAQVHPLLAVRGPPGTHEVAAGVAILRDLRAGRGARIPRFDKLADDRLPEALWREVAGPVEVVIFEGWCVGASAQAADELARPVNDLERLSDADGAWRRHVNAALAGEYHPLFGTLDMLVLLRAPDFAVVHRWRLEQEATSLARRRDAAGAAEPGAPARAMGAAAVAEFIQYYERLTRHMLAEMPARADLVIELDEARAVRGVHGPAAPRETQAGVTRKR